MFRVGCVVEYRGDFLYLFLGVFFFEVDGIVFWGGIGCGFGYGFLFNGSGVGVLEKRLFKGILLVMW